MLKIKVPATEYYDEATGEFCYIRECTLQLEHSLVSISKWESKWHKPFLGKDPKTKEETLDYIRCMTITQNVDPKTYIAIPKEASIEIDQYLENSMTATTFNERQKSRANNRIITSELIYHWMISLQIPLECEKWHLNRLLTLIKVCNIKNQPQKKMGRKEMMHSRSALNAARKNAMNTKG